MVKLRRKLDSETLHLPEIKPLIGRMVEITIEEQVPEVREEFYVEAARLPDSAEALEAQKDIFRNWRKDPRFEPYWSMLDYLCARTFEDAQKWTAAAEAVRNLNDYDFDAWREQRGYDLKHANDHLP
jgi:hypothetical protein